MWLLTFVLLILLGLLGIAGWLKAQRPDAGRRLQPIEQFEGWIGAVGLVWGILLAVALAFGARRVCPRPARCW